MGDAMCLEDFDEELLRKLLSLKVSAGNTKKGRKEEDEEEEEREQMYPNSQVERLQFQFEVELQRRTLEFKRQLNHLREENEILRTGISSYERAKQQQDQEHLRLHDELRKTKEMLQKSEQRNYMLSLHLAEAMRPTDPAAR